MANLKCSNFASTAVSNLSLQKTCSMVQLTVAIMQWVQILLRDVSFIQ